MRHRACIGLGSNLPSPAGEPRQTLQAALADLAEAGRVAARSSFYRTEPVGLADQPPFLNAVAELETELEPEPLLDFLLGIERRYGRDRSLAEPNGPRTLDLDLLVVDALVLRTPRLTLPHPALAQRRFVLQPLAEIAPELRVPGTGRTAAELLESLPDAGPNRRDAVRRLP